MNLRDKIWVWADSLEDWQNDLLRRIYDKGELTETDRQEVKENLFATILGIELPNQIIRLQKDQIQTGISDEEPVRIKKLSDLKNVGKVTEDGSLTFLTDGLTIIYGDNGAGKSSYARVLKKACRAIKQDIEIHPNAFEYSTGSGTAEIEIIKNDHSETIRRDVNDRPESLLNSISIYDRECAEAYTDGKVLDIPYLPSDLQAMKQMAEEQKKIQAILNEEVTQLQSQNDTLEHKLEDFPQDETIYPLISDLNAQTDLKKLEELKGLSEDEIEELENAEKKFAESDPTKIQKVIKDLNSKKADINNIIRRVDQIEKLVNKNLDKVFPDLINEIYTLKESQKLLREEFANDLPGTGNEAWKRLWNSAKHFSVNHAYPNLDYPVLKDEGKNAKCVLCQQTLDQDGVEDRLIRFEKYISDDIEKQLNEQRTQRDEYITKLEQIKINDLLTEQTVNLLNDNNPDLLAGINAINDLLLNVRIQIITSLKEETWNEEIAPISNPVKEELDNLVEMYGEKIEAYESLKDSSKREKLESKIKELHAKKRLEEHHDVVKDIVNKKRRISIRQEGTNLLNSRAITDKVSSLGSDIANIIEDNLNNNLRDFRISNLSFEIKGRGREGEAKSEFLLENQKKLPPNAILSDGENNGVSIAYFLSEVSHTSHNGTLIFDDPVTSLDHGHREKVAKKIIEEVKLNKRQSIIFTHDIVFLLELEQKADKTVPVKVIYLRSDDITSGIVIDEDKGRPWVSMTVNQRLTYLNKRLDEIKKELKSDPVPENKVKLMIKGWYELLRESWERAVEELMLGDVVNRFRTGVATGYLDRVKVTEDLIIEVDNQMSHCSNQAHDQAPERNNPIPDTNEMEDDISALKEFRKKLIK
jgi:energy-coupling factor transporter ATP-binding protein EcfA2